MVNTAIVSLPDGFSVGDDGPGISPGDREEIFEAVDSTATEGTGFGLSIVKQIGEDPTVEE